MIWTIGIIILVGLIFIFMRGKKPIPEPPVPPVPPIPPIPPIPIPDPTGHKWNDPDETSERWKNYLKEMAYVVNDTWMAKEMRKKDDDGKLFYIWTAEDGDYWETPDETHEKGKVDCDGFARLTSDGLGRFAKYEKVWWLECYGYYRYYYYDKLNDKFTYDIRLGGHAITAYKKDGILNAFSNTQWWNKDFPDFVSIAGMTFPEGVIIIRCRNWKTGKLEWVLQAKEGYILEGSNIFDRKRGRCYDQSTYRKL